METKISAPYLALLIWLSSLLLFVSAVAVLMLLTVEDMAVVLLVIAPLAALYGAPALILLQLLLTFCDRERFNMRTKWMLYSGGLLCIVACYSLVFYAFEFAVSDITLIAACMLGSALLCSLLWYKKLRFYFSSVFIHTPFDFDFPSENLPV
jgi:hypothetical protein